MLPDTSPDHAVPITSTAMMSSLIDSYEFALAGCTIYSLEAALAVTGPLLYRGNVYGLAAERAWLSLAIFRSVRRAELVPIP